MKDKKTLQNEIKKVIFSKYEEQEKLINDEKNKLNEEIKNIITNIRSSKKRGSFFEKARVWKFIKNTFILSSPFLFLDFILSIHYILNYSDVSVKPIGAKIETVFDLVTMCSISTAVIFMFLIFIVENFRNLIKNKKGVIFYKLKEI